VEVIAANIRWEMPYFQHWQCVELKSSLSSLFCLILKIAALLGAGLVGRNLVRGKKKKFLYTRIK
jgi:hypothetical protein